VPGILQRYVAGEVLRAFLLALLTITTVIVLFMVMIEAAKMGLTPREILNLVPYVIPGSLPYTIPVSLLFTVTVVYGRLASDNEVIAVKTAGLSAWTVLRPSVVLGFGLSVLMLYLSWAPIPRANNLAKRMVFKNMEEMFYKFLKRDREFNNPRWPFLIKVRDVEGKVMLDPTFKQRGRDPKNPTQFGMIVQAQRATLHFDTEHSTARVYLDRAEVQRIGPQDDVVIVNDKYLDIPIPNDNRLLLEKRIQERTTSEMVEEQAKFRWLMAQERKRQAMAAALWIGSGRINRVSWDQVQRSFLDYGTWDMRWKEFETEKHLRIAMSCGSFFFVMLGAPVGILFARRDFLSAFISCFVPIIILYYPLTLLGVNLSKEGLLNVTLALWSGNAVLAVLTGFVLPSVMKH
jgi:lipopolysaccharide export system permease protein